MLVDLGELSAKISSLMLHRTQLTALRSISTGLCPKYFEKRAHPTLWPGRFEIRREGRREVLNEDPRSG